MKSLERLKHIENAPEFMGGDERYKRSINSPIRYIEDITAIKQDLEVLEILRKHLYIHTSYGDSDYGEYEDKSICINEIHECFCKEHFNKLKQWLEVNENA